MNGQVNGAQLGQPDPLLSVTIRNTSHKKWVGAAERSDELRTTR